MVQAAEPQSGAPTEQEEVLPRAFGKYTLLRRLASGGMAELFLALQRSVAGFEKLIVIKRILPAMNQDQGFIEMLLHEARVAATLQHPNVVHTYDVGQAEGCHFIAMEHIQGKDLRSIIRAMRHHDLREFPLEHALFVIGGMCAGLAYAHDKRGLDGGLMHIVHRDISPQNIVVTFTGDVKIVDFGVAKSGKQVGEDTKDGQLKGKVPYMSPEQAAGEAIDWRSDIFAVGVILFELTTGRRLFKGTSEFETLKLICEREYPRPSAVKPGYPPELERIVMKALEKKREDRYQSAREMQSDLEDFARKGQVAVSSVALARWMGSLFADEITEQNAALQDAKQLADVIAAQQAERGSMYETMPGTAGSAPGAAASIGPVKKGSGGLWLAGGVAVAAALGVFVYMQMRTRALDAEAQVEAAASAAAALPTAAPEAPKPKGSIEVASTPDGCAIWINGDLRQEVTPAKVEGLPLDTPIQLKLTKDGLEAYRETLTLTEAEPNKKVATEMKVGSVTVLIKVDPPPTVWVDGKPWAGERTKVTGLSAGEEHRIVLSANGYVAKTVNVTAQQGETKTIDERLLKAEPGSGAGAAPAPDDTGKPAAAAPSGPGTVRVGAKGGYCNVSVNGVSYGPTPTEATVSAGTARVTCKPASGPSQTQTVQVQPGQIARVSFKLGE